MLQKRRRRRFAKQVRAEEQLSMRELPPTGAKAVVVAENTFEAVLRKDRYIFPHGPTALPLSYA